MILTVICQVCGEQLAVLEKDQISQSDISNYQQSCACDKDGQANIQIQVTDS